MVQMADGLASDLGSILGRVNFLINLIMKISQVSAIFPGCGQSGKLPNCEYRVKLQYEYLSALLDKLNLPQKVMFVIHDWGSALGFHWCNIHRDRVKVCTPRGSALGFHWCNMHRDRVKV